MIRKENLLFCHPTISLIASDSTLSTFYVKVHQKRRMLANKGLRCRVQALLAYCALFGFHSHFILFLCQYKPKLTKTALKLRYLFSLLVRFEYFHWRSDGHGLIRRLGWNWDRRTDGRTNWVKKGTFCHN